MATSNILMKFRNLDSETGFKTLTAFQFMEVWNFFDVDGNGYIENQELDAFVKQLFGCLPTCQSGDLSAEQIEEIKVEFLQAFDDNKDNRIDIREMAQILPTDENFLVLFQIDHPLASSVDFMKVWKQFDVDCSGYIEGNELKNFLRELLQLSKTGCTVTEDQLLEYTETMLNLFDRNNDGKLQLSEMARLIPIRENFLLRPVFKKGSKITNEDIDTVFNLYDKDRNGMIENEELHGFLKDLLELVYEDYDTADLEALKNSLMRTIDADKDGKLNKKELRLLINLIDHANEHLLG